MEDYKHQAASEQHIRLRQQSLSQAHPPRLEHQSPTHGATNPWEAEAVLEAHLQQALAALQDLEHQRLQMLSQDSGANQHL